MKIPLYTGDSGKAGLPSGFTPQHFHPANLTSDSIDAIAQSTKSARGFTLIETLIAITVLTISIVGPFQIVQGVLQSAYNARDQLIGAGLAQEGVEFVREIRDSNYLYNARYGSGSVPTLEGFGTVGGNPDCYSRGCKVDTLFQTIVDCGAATCASSPLYLDNASRYNQQMLGTPTKFTRTVRLTTISANEVLVTVTVTWENHGSKSVVLQEYFRDWL